MRVVNVHTREIPAAATEVAALLARLASPTDALWPASAWWPQRFDGGLVVGAKGGHGRIRYMVERVTHDHVVYRFPPRGDFVGTHRFDVEDAGPGTCILRHTLDMDVRGRGRLMWPLVIRPLHDALIEDALDNAERTVTGAVRAPARYSVRVRLLRRLVGAGRVRRTTRGGEEGGARPA